MPSTATYTCRCGANFIARTADRKRGWGRFCSKSCKAKEQTSRTGYTGPSRSTFDSDWDTALAEDEAGWDGHKNAF